MSKGLVSEDIVSHATTDLFPEKFFQSSISKSQITPLNPLNDLSDIYVGEIQPTQTKGYAVTQGENSQS